VVTRQLGSRLHAQSRGARATFVLFQIIYGNGLRLSEREPNPDVLGRRSSSADIAPDLHHCPLYPRKRTSDHAQFVRSMSVGSSSGARELFTRFDTDQRYIMGEIRVGGTHPAREHCRILEPLLRMFRGAPP
jgi:hypothetical protein